MSDTQVFPPEPEDAGGGPPRRVGPFRLLRPLGRGGFGEVYLGEDDHGTRAAVKLLHPGWTGDPEMRERFGRELDQARKVSGFCLAEILDGDPDAPTPWIATEYIDGPTLYDAVVEQGPRTGGDLHRLAVSTATALAAIHAAGVVHRDLKPDNIMLAADGPRVIDFGIARGLEATAVTASGIVGTVGYMAPEQLEGARLGPSVDIFAWGAVMVFAATGREAFPGATQAARITRVLTGEPETGALAGPLLSAVRAALAKSPDDRPDAQSLMARLVAPPDAGRGSAGRTEPPAGATGGDAATSVLDPGAATGATRVAHPDPTKVEHPDPTLVEGAASAASGPPRASWAGGAASGPVRVMTGPVPPYHFNGLRFTDPAELAAAMQREWAAAVRVFSDPDELATLGAWLVEDLGDTTVDRAIFRRRPDDVHLAVAWFIAQLNPALTPVFRGQEATVATLARRFTDPRPLLTGDRAAGELMLLARPQLLRTLAQHDGQQDLAELAERLVAAEQAAQHLLGRLRGELVGWREARAAADTALMLTFLLHPDLVAKPEFSDSYAAEWADILWPAVTAASGPVAAGRAAAVYAVTPTMAQAGQRQRDLSLRLHDGRQDLESARQGRWVWAVVRPVHLILLIVGIILTPLGCLAGLAEPDSANLDSYVIVALLGLGALAVAVVIRIIDRPRDGYPNARTAARAKVAFYGTQLPQLEASLAAIKEDQQRARRICAPE